MKVTAGLDNGSICFVRAINGRPETRETTNQGGANVTHITEAVAAEPAYYEATYFISAYHQEDGPETGNHFHIKTCVMIEDDAASYHAVEDAGANQLPELFRRIADALQVELDDATARRAKAASV